MAWYAPAASALIRLLGRLAPDTSDRCGAALGLLAMYLGIRRRVAADNLARALGLSGGPARRRILRRSYCTMGADFITLFSGAADPADFASRISEHGPAWCDHLQRRWPAPIILTAHLGCWIAGGTALVARWGALSVYATAQHEPRVDALITAHRRALGVGVVPATGKDPRAVVTTLRELRQGHPVALLADQGPRPARGEPGRFLGQATYNHGGPAFFARRTGHPLVPAFAIRRRAGRYQLLVGRPLRLSGDPAADVQICLDCLSAMIARFPDRYFWHHRRFKYRADLPPRSREPWRDQGMRLFYQP